MGYRRKYLYLTTFDPIPRGLCPFFLLGFNRIPNTGGELFRPLGTSFMPKKRHSHPNCSYTSHPACGKPMAPHCYGSEESTRKY